jgi:hypothetical protein
MKKRRTKEDMVTAAKKKKVDEKTMKAALHQLYQFIATKEDCLAEDEVNAHTIASPHLFCPSHQPTRTNPSYGTVIKNRRLMPLPVNVRGWLPFILAWYSQRETDRMPSSAIDVDSDEDPETFSNGDDKEEEVKVTKKWKTGAFDAIHVLWKKPNVDAQAILKTAAGLSNGMFITFIVGKQVELTSLDDRKAGEKGTMDDEKIM